MPNQEQTESLVQLYEKATESDWRTVQQAAGERQPGAGGETAAAEAPAAEAPTSTAETVRLMNVARSILVNENGTVG
jgi:hypothetical protein